MTWIRTSNGDMQLRIFRHDGFDGPPRVVSITVYSSQPEKEADILAAIKVAVENL